MVEEGSKIKSKTTCFHCGDDCKEETIAYDGKNFCCYGCKTIYQLFEGTELESFYQERSKVDASIYDFLNEEKFAKSFIKLKTDNYLMVQLNLPSIHCSSCLYVLENMHKVDEGIKRVTVNFTAKKADILFDPNLITLPEVCALLSSIGYKPDLNYKEDKNRSITSDLALKIGVAGFCFGNIMLLAFPEYLGLDMTEESSFLSFFGYISFFLSFPVLLYSGNSYFISAYKGLKNGFFNIDVPIALGMSVLFARSTFEIFTNTGAGYLDSLSGLVFFLLIGRWFQEKTYEGMAFERDYTSYFPLAVIKLFQGMEIPTSIQDLVPADDIIIRNEEIVPCDSELISDKALIDYSFVTGEKELVIVGRHELVFAGGKVIGSRIQLKVKKNSSDSYLTSLWNNQVFKNEKHSYSDEITNKISKHFTIVILIIALLGGAYWYINDPVNVWQVISAVLIVACPCALALSAPFTNGNAIRIFGKHGLYLKKATIAEKLSDIDTVVFDKTGTITQQDNTKIQFLGKELLEETKAVIKTMAGNSTHPLSKLIFNYIYENTVEIESFEELSGKGLSCRYKAAKFKLGSAKWAGASTDEFIDKSRVYVSVEGEVLGYFEIQLSYRGGLSDLMKELSTSKEIMVLSGDNDSERPMLEKIFPVNTRFLFKQSPEDKLQLISELQSEGKNVLMLGDGLNDSGALAQSNVGIAVSDNISSFSPACDAILNGEELSKLPQFLSYAKRSKSIIFQSFTLSFLYNTVGIGLALSGLMSPIFAAILMPLSSISVVLFTTIAGNYQSSKLNL